MRNTPPQPCPTPTPAQTIRAPPRRPTNAATRPPRAPPTPAPMGAGLAPSRRTARANTLPPLVSPTRNNCTPRPLTVCPARRPNALTRWGRNVRRRIPPRKAQAAAPRWSSRSRPRLRVSLRPRQQTLPGNTLAPQFRAVLQSNLLRQKAIRRTSHSTLRPPQASRPPRAPARRQLGPGRKGQLWRSDSRPRR